MHSKDFTEFSFVLCTLYFGYVLLFSTISKPEKKELVIPLISKNKWRLPPSQSHSKRGEEEPPSKSAEEEALDREAAEAVLKGCVVHS